MSDQAITETVLESWIQAQLRPFFQTHYGIQGFGDFTELIHQARMRVASLNERNEDEVARIAHAVIVNSFKRNMVSEIEGEDIEDKELLQDSEIVAAVLIRYRMDNVDLDVDVEGLRRQG